MENETKEVQTRYEHLREQILKCIDKDYIMPKNIPYPFERAVLIKQLEQEEIRTESNIIIGGINANNVLKPNIGIVVAVGPKVPDYIIPKLRVYFNQNIDLEYFIGGTFYKMSDYSDIYAAIPEGTLTSMDTKDDKQVLREKRTIDSSNYELKRKSKEEEEKDVKDFLKKKGKTIILPNNFDA